MFALKYAPSHNPSSLTITSTCLSIASAGRSSTSARSPTIWSSPSSSLLCYKSSLLISKLRLNGPTSSPHNATPILQE